MSINVLALYADATGCGQYRVMFPAEAVNAHPDLAVRARVADHLDADATYQGTKIFIRRVDLPPNVQVVSFQRPMRAALVGAMKWLRERRPEVGLVVELDDDLMALPAQHEAFGGLNPRTNPHENTAWLRQALVLADAVTVTTPELARRYGASRSTFVIRNGVPDSMPQQCVSRALDENNIGRERIVGWAGYTGTHPGDLEITNGAVADVMERRPQGRTVRFRNVGPLDGVAKALGVPAEREHLISASGWLDTASYRAGLSALDIGIVPLQDTAFNRAKSTLKALEFAAAGVPVIASNLPEFVALRQAGLPLWLVRPKRKEWATALTHLVSLSDDELREVAHAHRMWVVHHATVNAHAEEWAHAWTYAASVAQRRIRAAS